MSYEERAQQDAIARLPDRLNHISGFLELIEMDLRQQTAAINNLAEAVYTLAHVQIAQWEHLHGSSHREMGLDYINSATRMWLAERDQPDPAKENP